MNILMQRNQLHMSGQVNNSAHHGNSSSSEKTDKNRDNRRIIPVVDGRIISENDVKMKSIFDSVGNIRDPGILHGADENYPHVGVIVRKRKESSIHVASRSIDPFQEKSVSRVVSFLYATSCISLPVTRLKILKKFGPIFVYEDGCEISARPISQSPLSSSGFRLDHKTAWSFKMTNGIQFVLRVHAYQRVSSTNESFTLEGPFPKIT